MKNNKTTFFKKVIVSLTIFFLTGFAFQGNAQSGKDSKGTDFWVTFPENLGGNANLYISGEENTSGNISISGISYNQNFNVTVGNITTISLPTSVFLTNSGTINNNGIHITSNKEITVYGMNSRPYTSDAYLGLPTDALGTEYYVMTYTGLSSYGSQIGIVSTENATSVNFNLKTTVGSYIAGTTYTIFLNSGQTFYLKAPSNTDLTGSEITSNKPIAVFSGNQCANVPVNRGACDHLVEQMTPTSGWGKNFVTVPLKTRSGDTFRFLAGTNGTQISVNGSVVANLNQGQFYEYIYNTSLNITSNEPILVAQYSNGSSYDGANADPAMILISPFEQFLGAYTINTPSSGFAYNFVNIVASVSAIGNIQLDGNLINPGLFIQIGTTDFYGAQVDLTIGTHTLTSNGLPFGAIVYGFNNYDSYGYPAGASYSPIATVSTVEITPKTGNSIVDISTCFTAKVLDQYGDPVVGVRVDFSIVGANPTSSGFANTDANGDAIFCYAGNNVGEDTISASIGTIVDGASFTWNPLQIAPEVICPENIIVNNTPSECGAIVNFIATDTAGTPESVITYSQDPGTFFPVGDTEVTVTATNSVDTSSCTFTVTVQDNISPVISGTGDITTNTGASNEFLVVAERAGRVSYVSPSGVRTVFTSIPSADGIIFETQTTAIVSSFGGGKLYRADFVNNTATQIADLGGGVQGLEIDGLGYLYATNEHSKKIQRVDLATNQVTDVVTGLNRPIDILLENGNNLLISEFNSGQIIRYNLVNNTSTVVTSGLGGPTDIFSETQNTIVVAEYYSGKVTRVNLTDGTKTVIANIGGGPHGIVKDSDDNLYVNQYNVGKIVKILPNGSFSVFATGFGNPVFLSINPSGGCETTVNLGNVLATDNCGIASFENDAPDVFNVGTTAVTYTAIDNYGNTTTYVQNVTVEDHELPTVATIPDLEIGTDSNSCSASNVDLIIPVAKDNCGVASITNNAPAIFPLGETIVTYTITDINGNVATTSNKVIVSDTTAPIVVGQNISVTLTANGTVSIIAADVLDNGSDNCGTVTYSINQNIFGAADAIASPVTIQLTATDANGNETSVPVQVTVIDPVPVVITQNITVFLDENGQAIITPDQIDNGSSSVVGIGSLSLDISTFDCSNTATPVTVTLTATSTIGSSASGIATVTVKDNITPTVLTKDITVQLDANGNASITPDMINDGSFDNCKIDATTLDQTDFSCDNIAGSGSNNFALNYDGNDNVNIQDSQDLRITGDMSIEAWFKMDSNPGDWVRIVGKGSPGPRNYGLWYHPSGVFLFQQYGSGVHVSINQPVVQGKWYHMAATKQGGLTKLFINGVLVSTANGGTNPATSADPLTIGYAGFHAYHRGQIDEVRLWNAARTNQEILDNYNVGLSGTENGLLAYYNMEEGQGTSLTDLTGNGHEGTIQGATWTASSTNLTGGSGSGNEVTLTVTDVNGNSSSATAIVTVQDNIAPNVITQDITVELDVNGVASITTDDINNGSSDACGIKSYTLDIDNFTCENVGANNVTLSVEDNNGNIASLNATVTVQDNIAPNVITQNITVELDVNGVASITADDVNNGSTDACGIKSYTLDIDNFTCENVGANNVILTVEDNNGNVASLNATVTVQDNIAPSVITQNITVELDENGAASITPSMIDNGSSDACGIESYTLNIDSFDCSNIGTNEVILTVEDNNGNVASLNATVTVQDNIAPNVITQNITVELDENGVASITTVMIDIGSSDACGIESYTLNIDSFDCSNIGTNEVILTVEDNNGNVASLDATVTVQDNIAPNVITQNITVELDENGVASITPSMIDDGSADACGIKSYTLDIYNFTCENVGANNVILSVEDINGNVASLNAVVTVKDVTAPNVITQNITVELDENGNASITTAMINDGSSDACGIESYSLDVDTFDCSNTGANNVILSVKDNNGNVASLNATVTVQDNIAPTVITQTFSMNLANGVVNITPSDIDRGTFDNCVFTLTIDQDHFTCDDIGDHVVTLTATDASGNSSSSTAIVSVLGDVPTIGINDFTAVQNQKKNTIFLGFGSQSVNLSTVTSGGSGFSYEWTTSTGEMVSNEANPSISPEVSTTYNVIVTNSNGCSASTSIDVCVIDARSFDKKGRDTGKVTVCHHTNGKKGTKHVEINISANAVMTHLTQHGVGTDHADSLGACNAVCVENSSSKAITKTTIDGQSILDNLNVYPNPSNGIFDIQLTTNNLDTRISLFDTNGKLIQRKFISKENSSDNIITIGNLRLSSGIYLLRIINKNESVIKKLVVEKSH
jgi:hypothetical protein